MLSTMMIMLCLALSDASGQATDPEVKLTLGQILTGNNPTLLFSPDSSKLAAGDQEGAYIWDVATGAKLQSLNYSGGGSEIDSISFSPDSSELATGSFRFKTSIWDVVTGVELYRMSVPGTEVAFSPDGSKLAIRNFGFQYRL